jgi:hypothetical protein
MAHQQLQRRKRRPVRPGHRHLHPAQHPRRAVRSPGFQEPRRAGLGLRPRAMAAVYRRGQNREAPPGLRNDRSAAHPSPRPHTGECASSPRARCSRFTAKAAAQRCFPRTSRRAAYERVPRDSAAPWALPWSWVPVSIAPSAVTGTAGSVVRGGRKGVWGKTRIATRGRTR